MPRKSKGKKSRYSEPQYICPKCEKEYKYNRDCNGCGVPVVPIEGYVPREKVEFDKPQVDVITPEGDFNDMPVKDDSPLIDLSTTPKMKQSKRAAFEQWMSQIYGLVNDIVDSTLPGDENKLVREGIKFNVVEQGQMNQFVYLILKNFFPKALDALVATGGAGGEGGIISIVISGVFVAIMLIKKMKLVSSELKKRSDKNGPSNENIPPKYQSHPNQ